MRPSDLRDYLALRRFLVRPWEFVRTRRRRLGEGGGEVEFLGGFSVRVRRGPMDRHVLHRIFARDEYRLGGVPPGAWDTVVDVGANIGLFAVRAAPLARRVLCYEPDGVNFDLLERNLSGPRFAHVARARRAVAGRRGTVTLHRSRNPGGHSLRAAHLGSVGSVAVEAVTLEDVFREHAVAACDLLKLDCEGAEYGILAAVPGDLWPRIARVRLEYHGAGAAGDGAGLRRMLEGRGFRCESVPSARDPARGLLFARRG